VCSSSKIWHLRAGYPASNLKRFFEAGCHQDICVRTYIQIISATLAAGCTYTATQLAQAQLTATATSAHSYSYSYSSSTVYSYLNYATNYKLQLHRLLLRTVITDYRAQGLQSLQLQLQLNNIYSLQSTALTTAAHSQHGPITPSYHLSYRITSTYALSTTRLSLDSRTFPARGNNTPACIVYCFHAPGLPPTLRQPHRPPPHLARGIPRAIASTGGSTPSALRCRIPTCRRRPTPRRPPRQAARGTGRTSPTVPCPELASPG